MKHKNRLVPLPQIKLTTKPEPQLRLDGLRVVLGHAGGLVALTAHGLEVPLELSLNGLNKLHELLVEQQRVKEVPPLGVTPTYILAEWRRLPGEGNGKVHKSVPIPRPAKRAYTLEDLL